MAIVECISEKKQTPSAQKGVIDYCMQPSKTMEEGEQLAYVSGINCIPELAQESFLATQAHFGCGAGDVRFYHYVQSFKPEERLTSKETHAIGLELAQSFGNREVIVATHIDRDHLHNHFVVSAYDFGTGQKLHNNKFYLAELRKRSDEICQAHGLSVLKEYNPKKKSQRLNPKEYRAADRGNSWKMELRVAIDYCMAKARSKTQFKKEMKKLGYDMVYTPERKYITYILKLEDGQERRVRDIKLNEEKYRKENMDREFKIRAKLYGSFESKEHSSSTQEAGGVTGQIRSTGSTYGADQRRGMGDPNQSTEQAGENMGAFVHTEYRYGASNEWVQEGNDAGCAGTDSSSQEGAREDIQGSYGTGWESERESLAGYRETDCPRRSNMVASTVPDRRADDLSLAFVGTRGVGHLVNVFEDNSEETEEERKERQAQNAGTVAGLAIGATIALVQNSLRKDEQAENADEELYDDEDWDFDISM